MKITYGNILAMYFKASPADASFDWYLIANNQLASLALDYKGQFSLQTIAAVTAALSPNNRWERNLIDCKALINAYNTGGLELASSIKCSTYNNNKIKALKILAGGDPLDILGGLKVRAFYDNLLLGDSVTVDGHAYSIWAGEYIPTTKTPKISPKLYNQIVADYRLATEAVNNILNTNFKARQIQSTTWLTLKRLVSDYVN